ncbi:lipid-A-disaccharide synthase [Geomesophilobacter sediminis]|uniref:Lipid-A-disaccharide synthase n=1 Tax=Geomesophilobacter sediminis TaxID=2798584 RepID=A0A8J7IQ82_9BACT|nr:lipid-A-disaccharide synthase [Geomesophilobacter sediminis]MBJ6725958.1 lipid-A-disaccharide synthase [Geomesophilobacter sediminis]
MIVAGEASGEMYGARIAAGLRALLPDVELFGMGGDCMRREGVDTLVDANVMAVMGIVEVVAHLPTIAKGFTTLKKRLLNDPPDLVICIDYPDFNLRLGKVAKDAGIKVLHFVSPTIWAWRPGRIHGIGRAINRMAVLFPFEVPYYERAGIPVSFVGHPLLDMVHPTMGKDEAVRSFGLDPSRRTLGLFPGSRKSVLKRLLPVVLESARQLKGRFPGLQFLLPLASSLREADLAPYLDGCGLEIKVVSGRNYDLMVACDAAISVSGTVIMELALVGVPMVLIYKVPWLNYEIGKRVINVDHIGICNIVAEKRVVQELIQHEAEPPRIVAEIERILNDPVYNAKMRAELAEVRVRLGSGGALERLAKVAAEMLQ